jgi:glycosyltransferase involved in cell wall biosynthesis
MKHFKISKGVEVVKVLMVTARYFPYMGGVETHVYEVGRRLAGYGVDVTLLTTQPHNSYPTLPENEEVEGIHIIRVPAWPPQRDYYIAPKIIEIIKDGNWDLIHCQGCHTFVPLLAMHAARIAHKPYIVTFHTGGHSSIIRHSLRTIQWRLLRPFFAHAAKLIGVSQFEVNYFRTLLHLPVEQFALVPNGITTAVSSVEQVSMPDHDHPLLVSVGRLERYKGHHRIIAALPYIQRKYPDAQLLILGQGPYEVRLRNLARKVGVFNTVEIRAIPAAEREQMAMALRQAALVVLLSKYESHPIAVLEAIAQRRSVLVANTSGLKDLAEQKLVSAIPFSSTPLQIAEAVNGLLENPYIPPASLILPSWDDSARQLLDIYQAVVRRNVCVF